MPAWARTGTWLGLLVAAQLFTSEELALTTALAGVLVVLVLAVSRPRTAIRRAAPAAAGLVIAAVVALALTGSALWTQFRGPLTVHGRPTCQMSIVNDFTSFVTPQGALFFHTAASAAAAASYQGGLPEYLGYLGWPLIGVLAVAAVASWRRLAGRAAAITLVVLCVCSLGGHPLIAGRTYPAVDLPWHWIETIPAFAPIPDGPAVNPGRRSRGSAACRRDRRGSRAAGGAPACPSGAAGCPGGGGCVLPPAATAATAGVQHAAAPGRLVGRLRPAASCSGQQGPGPALSLGLT